MPRRSFCKLLFATTSRDKDPRRSRLNSMTSKSVSFGQDWMMKSACSSDKEKRSLICVNCGHGRGAEDTRPKFQHDIWNSLGHEVKGKFLGVPILKERRQGVCPTWGK